MNAAPAPVFVKVCGLTTEEDALSSVAMGADALGFVFAPSPRQLTVQAARDIVRRLPDGVLTVGVFRNEHPDRVVRTVQEVGLDAAQLHGDESPEVSASVRPHVRVLVKGFVAGSQRLASAEAHGADVILVDSPKPGSGQVFDWSLAEGAPGHRRILLAGGLTPDNVAVAVERVQPWGVDVSTGVESSPGRKDARRVRSFIQAARSVERHSYVGEAPPPFDWQEDW